MLVYTEHHKDKMIKQATTFIDLQDAIALLQRFLKDTAYEQGKTASTNREHLGRLCHTIQNAGYIWLAYIDDQAVGILAAVKEPNMWSPKHQQLRELVWYVLPEYREQTVGGRLFLTYCNEGDSLIRAGVIDGYFTTRMATTNNIDLERRGFKLKESTYLKEH
jgi:hypothetical protein